MEGLAKNATMLGHRGGLLFMGIALQDNMLLYHCGSNKRGLPLWS